MIIYGVLAEASILKLFIAGIIPGILLAVCFMGFLALRASLIPGAVPPPEQERMSLWQRVAALRHLGPVLIMLLLVFYAILGMVLLIRVFQQVVTFLPNAF